MKFKYLFILTAIIWNICSSVYVMTEGQFRKKCDEIVALYFHDKYKEKYIIDGKSVRTVWDEWGSFLTKKAEQTEDLIASECARRESYVSVAVSNELNCRNIISVNSNGVNYVHSFGYPNPADYQNIGGTYYHNFLMYENRGEDWKVYECKHYSKSSLDNHVYWLNECSKAYERLRTESKTKLRQEKEERLWSEAAEKLDIMFEPYKKLRDRIYHEEFQKDYNRKQNVLSKFLAKVEKINCQAVLSVDQHCLGDIKLGQKTKRCKSLNLCQLSASEKPDSNSPDKAVVVCKCGHSFSEHKFKFKSGVDAKKMLQSVE